MLKLCHSSRLSFLHLLSYKTQYGFADENTQLKLPSGSENKKSEKPIKGNDLS